MWSQTKLTEFILGILGNRCRLPFLFRHAENLVHRGNPLQSFQEAILHHGNHAVLNGNLLKLRCRGFVLENQFFYLWVHGHDFVNADAAAVAQIATLAATLVALKGEFTQVNFDSSFWGNAS